MLIPLKRLGAPDANYIAYALILLHLAKPTLNNENNRNVLTQYAKHSYMPACFKRACVASPILLFY